MKSESSRVYKLDLTYGLFISIILVAISTYLISISSLNDFTSVYRARMAMARYYILIFFGLMGVCYPLVRTVFSVKINKEGVGCVTGPYPFFSTRLFVRWSKIERIHYKKYFFFRFYILLDREGNEIGWVPFGLEKIQKLMQDLEEFDPSNKLLNMMRLEKRQRVLTLFPTLANEFDSLHVDGQIVVVGSEFERSAGFLDVAIYIKGFRVMVIKANEKGVFRGNFEFFPGEYNLVLVDRYYEGSTTVSLPGPESTEIRIDAIKKAS